EFLDALLRYDGRGDSLLVSSCPSCECPGISGTYRCIKCFDHQMVCQDCCLQRHENLPLHHINVWNGAFFEHMNLAAMGLRVYLGHTNCPMKKEPSLLTIIHTNGIHRVVIIFCGCGAAIHPQHQLLRRGWYPATIHQPSTCVTFIVLNHFHLQTLQSKLSAMHFVTAIERETDNMGLVSVKDRYISFLQMIHEWRHLMMLKRAGHGHDGSGVKGTRAGELAILCPACPHPGINMPSDWESCPPSDFFLHRLHIAADTNFHMKNRFKPGVHPDPGLGTGWAYFVENKEYKEFLLGYVSEKDISTCSGLTALDLANTRKSMGLHVTGVGASVCAHQGCIRPLGLGDLQKGKQYSNMDFIIFSSLRSCTLRSVLLSYDIFCQWMKKQQARHAKLPPMLHLNPNTKLTGVIPKFHLPAHKQQCHTKYSLNLRPGSGCTDGEGIERDWANINPAALSTKEMGEGSRHDTIDDLFGDWNYRKVMGLGKSLLHLIPCTTS
ncbi:hypothetical protein BS47DRAFT_1296509, partial [Hydnum rufescens UP504]